jgi:hypothetical protein
VKRPKSGKTEEGAPAKKKELKYLARQATPVRIKVFPVLENQTVSPSTYQQRNRMYQ